MPQNESSQPDHEIPEEHRVVIAAVVASIAGPYARIAGIRPAAEGAGAWATRGRAAIHASHNIQRGPSAIRSLAAAPGAQK